MLCERMRNYETTMANAWWEEKRIAANSRQNIGEIVGGTNHGTLYNWPNGQQARNTWECLLSEPQNEEEIEAVAHFLYECPDLHNRRLCSKQTVLLGDVRSGWLEMRCIWDFIRSSRWFERHWFKGLLSIDKGHCNGSEGFKRSTM